MAEETQDVQFNVMPGADGPEPTQETLDLNFGLGEEEENEEESTDELEEEAPAAE